MNIQNLHKQNTYLLAGNDSLLGQNKIMLQQLRQYRYENEGLKKTLKIQFDQTFRMMTFPNGGIGFNTPYKSQKYHYRNALDEYQAGNVYSAKIILEMLLEKKPNYSNALNLLGLILNELGNPDEALVFLNKAYSLSNDEKILQNINLVKENPGKKLGISLD